MSSGYKRKLDEEIARKYESCPSCGRRDRHPCPTCEECKRCCRCPKDKKAMTKSDIVYEADFRMDLDAHDKVVIWQGTVVGVGTQRITVEFKHHRERYKLRHAERVLQPTRKLALTVLFRTTTEDLVQAQREVKQLERKLELVKKALAVEEPPSGCTCGGSGDMRCPVHGLLS